MVQAIADSQGLKPEQVFAGVGSDDVLAMCFLTFFNSGKPILFPDITYSFYDVWAEVFRIPYETQPLNEDFDIVAEDYYKGNGGVIFPNPNAPTGVEAPQEMIEDILRHNQDVIVIVDEAYVDFGAVSAVPLLEKYENLIVVQTFSKSRSLAGMRIGYAMANPALIRYLNDVKYSFNSYTMNQTAIAAGRSLPGGPRSIFMRRSGRSWLPESGRKHGFAGWDFPSGIPKATLFSPPMSAARRRNCSRRCGSRIFMSATLRSPGLTIICGSRWGQTRRWTRFSRS